MQASQAVADEDEQAGAKGKPNATSFHGSCGSAIWAATRRQGTSQRRPSLSTLNRPVVGSS
jgi:hypothetical protein